MYSPTLLTVFLAALSSPVASHRSGKALEHQVPQVQKFMSDDSIDVTTDSEFFGLTTFANLPYVNCLKPDESQGRYDIAILGAPFDTVSHPFKGHL
jgi:hypothetical protein